MAVPGYQDFMLPLLEYASDGLEHKIQVAYEDLSKQFNLSEEDKSELLPSGTQLTYKNRIGWAKTYLLKAGLLGSERRGFFFITEEGKKVLETKPSYINNAFLKQFESFVEFHTFSKSESEEEEVIEDESDQTPTETIELNIKKLNRNLSGELLNNISQSSPSFFEELVVQLLVKMGYGGSIAEAGQVVGKSGDEGIDGIIKEDRLGLDVIYLQAKRWQAVVGRPEIQKFVGALQGKRARKGVFITTSGFSREAREYVDMIDSRVILIDGLELTRLMVEYGLGVSLKKTYEIKEIDSDFFVEE
jgi:restriction system protein